MQNRLTFPLMMLMAAPMVHAASPVCTVSGGVMTAPTGDYCQGEPDYYSIKIYEMGLCTSAPTPPTTSSGIDLSNCEVVFTNSAGFDVEVERGVSTALSGTTTKPADGTYTHGYIMVNKNFVIRAAVTFNQVVSDDPSGAEENASDYSGLGSGLYCVTTNGTSAGTGANMGSSVDVSYESSTTCSNDPSILNNPGTLISPLNDVGGGTWSAIGSEGTVTAYLVDAGGDLASNQGEVDSLVGVQDFSASPIVVTATSTTMDARFRVSQGMSVSDVSGGGNRIGIGNGPFFVDLSVQ